MTTKYHGLPDIDTAADVFETPDEPEGLLKPTDSDTEEKPVRIVSDALDQSGLPDRRKAGHIFRKSTKRISKHSSPYLYSEDDSDSESNHPILESTSAKLRRLRTEIAELETSLSSQPSTSILHSDANTVVPKRKSVLPPRPTTNLVQELGNLKGRLERIDVNGESGSTQVASGSSRSDVWKDQLGRLTQSGPGAMEESRESNIQSEGGILLSIPTASVTTRSQSDLDARLAKLEDAMGQVEPRTPLIPTIDRLDHVLSLLTQPRHLDAISRRVKLLLVDLDRAAAAAKRNTQTGASNDKPSSVTLSQSEYDQMNSLFSLLPRLDPLLPILPPLVNRLQSLSGLHAEAAEVIDGLRRLQSDESDTSEELKELQTIVQAVQDGLTDSVKGIERNWLGVESRLQTLEKRIGQL